MTFGVVASEFVRACGIKKIACKGAQLCAVGVALVRVSDQRAVIGRVFHAVAVCISTASNRWQQAPLVKRTGVNTGIVRDSQRPRTADVFASEGRQWFLRLQLPAKGLVPIDLWYRLGSTHSASAVCHAVGRHIRYVYQSCFLEW